MKKTKLMGIFFVFCVSPLWASNVTSLHDQALFSIMKGIASGDRDKVEDQSQLPPELASHLDCPEPEYLLGVLQDKLANSMDEEQQSRILFVPLEYHGLTFKLGALYDFQHDDLSYAEFAPMLPYHKVIASFDGLQYAGYEMVRPFRGPRGAFNLKCVYNLTATHTNNQFIPQSRQGQPHTTEISLVSQEIVLTEDEE